MSYNLGFKSTYRKKKKKKTVPFRNIIPFGLYKPSLTHSMRCFYIEGSTDVLALTDKNFACIVTYTEELSREMAYYSKRSLKLPEVCSCKKKML